MSLDTTAFNKEVPEPPRESDDRLLSPETVVKELVAQYGFPLYGNKLNEPFWAACYRSQQTELLFELNEREFYIYNKETGLFVAKSTDSIREELANLVLDASRRWTKMEKLAEARSERNLSGVIAHLRGQTEQTNPFSIGGKTVHLANCILRFNDEGGFTIEEFSPKLRSRNRSPIVYDPAATCKQFQTSLLGHLDQDDRELLQKCGGQCLLGRNLTQRILILDGVGGASKGAFVLVTRGIVGPSNTCELRTKHLGNRFEIGRMVGKTLLLGADVKAKFLSQEGANRLKALVGGDTLEGEKKCSNKQLSIQGNFNILITSNCRLQVQLEGDQSAWDRRLIIVRYERPYTGKTIPDIHDQLLKAEGSGILNFYLEGVRKLFNDIRQTGNIILSQRQCERVDALLSESDSLRIYLRQNLALSSAPQDDLTTEEIVAGYDKFALAAGWTPMVRSEIEDKLPDLMFELFGVAKVNDIKRDGKNKRGFSRMKLRQANDED